jgi:hypothetical protein
MFPRVIENKILEWVEEFRDVEARIYRADKYRTDLLGDFNKLFYHLRHEFTLPCQICKKIVPLKKRKYGVKMCIYCADLNKFLK